MLWPATGMRTACKTMQSPWVQTAPRSLGRLLGCVPVLQESGLGLAGEDPRQRSAVAPVSARTWAWSGHVSLPPCQRTCAGSGTAVPCRAVVGGGCVQDRPPPRRHGNNRGHSSCGGDSGGGSSGDASFLTQPLLYFISCLSKPLSFCMRRQMRRAAGSETRQLYEQGGWAFVATAPPAEGHPSPMKGLCCVRGLGRGQRGLCRDPVPPGSCSLTGRACPSCCPGTGALAVALSTRMGGCAEVGPMPPKLNGLLIRAVLLGTAASGQARSGGSDLCQLRRSQDAPDDERSPFAVDSVPRSGAVPVGWLLAGSRGRPCPLPMEQPRPSCPGV